MLSYEIVKLQRKRASIVFLDDPVLQRKRPKMDWNLRERFDRWYAS
jgi:hypothetical protein